jgi:hypothetical protein
MITFNDREFYRAKNDVNGNPRYILHWMAFARTYSEAYTIARAAGFKEYRGKDFGGGFITQSYSLQETVNFIERVISQQSEVSQ